MTARADISKHRRKVLADRLNRLLTERHEAFLKRHEHRFKESERTAWEKGEAKPPFYKEVLEEGVRRGDVVSREEHHATVEEWRLDHASVTLHAGQLRTQLGQARGEARDESQRAFDNFQRIQELETQLHEAQGRIGGMREALEVIANVGDGARKAYSNQSRIFSGLPTTFSQLREIAERALTDQPRQPVEALPPLYEEVKREAIARAEVVPYEDWQYEEDRADGLETQLREANAAAEFAQEQAEIAWAKLREAERTAREAETKRDAALRILNEERDRANRESGIRREAEGRIEEAREWLQSPGWYSHSYAGDRALSILAGTEKEGDRGE